MKAVVFHGVGDIHVDDVPEPQIQDPNDAILRLTPSETVSAIEAYEAFDSRRTGWTKVALEPAHG